MGLAPESVTGWHCLVTLIDGHLPGRGDMILHFPDDYKAVEFYDHWEKVPAWYKSLAYQPATPRRTGRPAQPARQCALIIYWTTFAPRFDPGLDPSGDVTRARQARIAAQLRLADSLRSKAASAAAKKPPEREDGC
jgi:hypothetical protein